MHLILFISQFCSLDDIHRPKSTELHILGVKENIHKNNIHPVSIETHPLSWKHN